MNSTNINNSPQEGEISLKSVILTIKELGRFLIGKWLIILLCVITGAALGVGYSLIKKPAYVAELTFILEDSKSSPLGSYSGLASQFGVDLGSVTGSSIFSGDNILEFLKSRLMVQKALLSPIRTGNGMQSIADYYIEVNNLKKSWKDEPLLKDLRFPLNMDRKSFTIQQDSILNIIYESIIKKQLVVSKPDKKLSFISAECISPDEGLSKVFIETLVKVATDFYVQTKTQRSKITVDKLQSRADSIETLLNRKTYSVAATQDLNLNPAKSLAGVSTELAARDKVILQTMYGEVIKNLELSKMSMAQETPIIQIVDTPILPLEKKKFGKLKGIVLGGFLGGFLIVAWLIVRRTYRRVMY